MISTAVGYNTQTLTAGDYNLISIPFAGVDGGSVKLADVMSGGNWNGGETSNDGDQLQVWSFNAQGIGGYTIYYISIPFAHCIRIRKGMNV